VIFSKIVAFFAASQALGRNRPNITLNAGGCKETYPIRWSANSRLGPAHRRK